MKELLDDISRFLSLEELPQRYVRDAFRQMHMDTCCDFEKRSRSSNIERPSRCAHYHRSGDDSESSG